jgi:hypothetical protein
MLAPHVDRLPLVSSAIINVDQDVNEPWCVSIIVAGCVFPALCCFGMNSPIASLSLSFAFFMETIHVVYWLFTSLVNFLVHAK